MGLRGIPGGTDTTRTTTPRVRGPCTMSTNEGRASKKAKIAESESLDGDSSDGAEPVDSRLSDGLHGAEPILPSGMWYE